MLCGNISAKKSSDSVCVSTRFLPSALTVCGAAARPVIMARLVAGIVMDKRNIKMFRVFTGIIYKDMPYIYFLALDIQTHF